MLTPGICNLPQAYLIRLIAMSTAPFGSFSISTVALGYKQKYISIHYRELKECNWKEWTSLAPLQGSSVVFRQITAEKADHAQVFSHLMECMYCVPKMQNKFPLLLSLVLHDWNGLPMASTLCQQDHFTGTGHPVVDLSMLNATPGSEARIDAESAPHKRESQWVLGV